MGCCFSTTKAPEHDPNTRNGPKHQQFPLKPCLPESDTTSEMDSRAPPPMDEETVKEVLSETPITKNSHISMPVEERKTQMPVIQLQAEKFGQMPEAPLQVEKHELMPGKGMQLQIGKFDQIPVIQLQAEKFEAKVGLFNSTEEVCEVSQVSEVFSMSESFSTATTATTATITEKKEDEATSKRSCREVGQRLNRSPAKVNRKRPYKVEVSSGRERKAKSPARRAEPSPERKNQVDTRSVRGRESAGQVTTRKLNMGSASIRRDTGEGSVRRSRSPATRTVGGVRKEGIGRSPIKTTRRACRTPAEGMDSGGNKNVNEQNDNVSQQPNESLENPNVSLECFIFL
ncbi:serine/arginine repetitive matrix protein 1-like [Quillaja saponaria]|uniref:Serine/arginine repetitive matrix protein 1-like n=1 Tax=Quillaja saponaria TaxID=32244 RepID=A0AAD7QH45_QUISA|nr:serine/arginine repetitive matrix protein 1-like [Quillaja saponaria]